MAERITYTLDEMRAIVAAAAGDYAGSTLPEHVSQALKTLQRIVKHTSFVAYLVRREGPILPICAEGIDHKGMEDYPAHFIQADPMRSTFGDPRADVTTLTECARQAAVDLRRNEFVNDFTMPRFGISHILGSNFLLDSETTLSFSLHRQKRLADFHTREVKALRIALPPIMRSLRVTHARDRALDALRRMSGDEGATRERETSGVAFLSAELEVTEACPVARRVLALLEESGGLTEILAIAQSLLVQLGKVRTFADHAIIRRTETGLVSIRVIAMRPTPGGKPSVQLLIDLIRSRVQPLIARLSEPYRLTTRETDVVALLHEGFNQNAIAERLGISVWSVRNHLMSIREKLRVRTNEQILARLLGVT